MKMPSCFVKTKINGEKMNVWRPNEEQKWAPIPDLLPLWKQFILSMYSPPDHTIVIGSKLVKVSVVSIHVFSKESNEELFELEVEDPSITIRSSLLGDDNTVLFNVGKDGMECELPWDDDYDFQIAWGTEEELDEAGKFKLLMLQVLHYMTEWFGENMSSSIKVVVSKDPDSNNESDDDDSDGDNSDKDYTFMDPWPILLPRGKTGIVAQGKCTEHDNDEEITFVFQLPETKEVKVTKTAQEKRQKKNIIDEKEHPSKKAKQSTYARPTDRSMPSYLVTRMTSRSLSESTDKTVWQLKQTDPLFRYPELSALQQHRVDLMWEAIKNSKPEAIVQFRDYCNYDIGFAAEAGHYNAELLSELTFILETIANRLTKIDDLIEVDGRSLSVLAKVLSPFDLINGNVAFLEFIG